MATLPGQLLWEIVKKNNCFLVKQNGNSSAKVQFSREPNNLYNLHTYKYSGLANNKTVSITPAAGEDLAVVVATTKTKKQHKPADSVHRSVLKKEFRKMARHVANQVDENYYRRDLKKAALARLSAVHKSLRVAKAGGKKKSKGKKAVRK
jgi:large subunit ribosomal protein L28e